MPRLGSGEQEALASRHGPAERLAELLPQGQRSRFAYHLTDIRRDAVSAVRAAPVDRLGVIMRFGVGESHCVLPDDEPHGQCSNLHCSPVFSREEVCYMYILT